MMASVLSPMFWFQPLFYAFHGWLATEMALWMLFHPYEPKYLPATRIQLPFTPGIFPRGRRKLSIAIADTITEILLTQEDIKKQAEKLVTEENLYKALDMLVDSIGQELRDIGNLRQLYRFVDRTLPPLLEKIVNDGINALETERAKGEIQPWAGVFQQLFDHTFLRLRIGDAQAEWMVAWVSRNVLTADRARQALIAVLTDSAILFIQRGVQEQVKGLQGLLVQFLDVQKGLKEFRQFLIREPEKANRLMEGALTQLNLEDALYEKLRNFSPQGLPDTVQEELRHYLHESLCDGLIRHRQDIAQTLANLSEEATHALTSQVLQIDFSSEPWLTGLKRDLARFLDTYLHKELENMLSRALPVISMNTVIVEKIDQFSAQQLEETIQRICKRELRWLAFLGAFLGFWLGLMSNLITFRP